MIDKYNEIGAYFKFNNKVFWFNGKRIEFITFVDAPVLYYNFQLYKRIDHKTLGFGKNFSQKTKKLNDTLALFAKFAKNQMEYADGEIYRAQWIKTGKGAEIVQWNKKQQCFVHICKVLIAYKRIIKFGNFIYCFDSDCKYDIIGLRWIPLLITTSKFQSIFRHGDYIYIVLKDGQMEKYDPKTDLWFKTFFNLSSK